MSIHGTPAGLLFAKQKGPVALASTKQGQKHSYNGKAESISKCFFGVYCKGDASIEAALTNSGLHLTNTLLIHHVDYEYSNTLGIVEYKTIVYYFDKNWDVSREEE